MGDPANHSDAFLHAFAGPSPCESVFDRPFTEQQIHVFLELWFGASADTE
jgi:hypothetical protein